MISPYTRAKFVALLLLLAKATALTTAQPQAAAVEKLPVRAALVLTPAFCESRIAHGEQENSKHGIEAGKAACLELDPALKEVFTALTTVNDPKDTGDAQLVLTPKFVDAGSLMEGLTSFSNYELDVFLQWTATDTSGRTVWLETVQGSARHHIGNLFTARKNLRLNIEDAVRDAAAKSASKISSARELRDFSPQK